MASFSTAIVRRDSIFTDIMQSLLNYAHAFEEYYGDPFVQARIVDIMNDSMSPCFLYTSSKAIYGRHVRLARLMLRQPEDISLLQRLRKRRAPSKKFEISHLFDLAL